MEIATTSTRSIRPKTPPKASSGSSRVEQRLQPKGCVLPDSVVVLAGRREKNKPGEFGGVVLQENIPFAVDNTPFSGYKEFKGQGDQGFPKAILALRHQVLDRSANQTAWSIEQIPDHNVQFLQHVREAFGDQLLVCVVSHVEHSSANERNLIRNLNNTRPVFEQDLIPFACITFERTGVCGKWETLHQLIHRGQIPFFLIDDNQKICVEFSHKSFGPGSIIHLKLRNKPWAPESIPYKRFLAECFDLVVTWCREVAEIETLAASSSVARR